MLPFMIWMAIGMVSSLGVLAVLMRTQEYITLEDVAALGVLSFLGPLHTAILSYLLWDKISGHLPKGDWRYKVVWSKEKKEKGFTLIEFMIIAALLGIVAAVAIPMCSAYETVKKDRERGIDTESVEYLQWLNNRMLGEEYQVPSRKNTEQNTRRTPLRRIRHRQTHGRILKQVSPVTLRR